MESKRKLPVVMVEMIDTAIGIAHNNPKLEWQVKNLETLRKNTLNGIEPLASDIQWLRNFIMIGPQW